MREIENESERANERNEDSHEHKRTWRNARTHAPPNRDALIDEMMEIRRFFPFISRAISHQFPQVFRTLCLFRTKATSTRRRRIYFCTFLAAIIIVSFRSRIPTSCCDCRRLRARDGEAISRRTLDVALFQLLSVCTLAVGGVQRGITPKNGTVFLFTCFPFVLNQCSIFWRMPILHNEFDFGLLHRCVVGFENIYKIIVGMANGKKYSFSCQCLTLAVLLI